MDIFQRTELFGTEIDLDWVIIPAFFVLISYIVFQFFSLFLAVQISKARTPLADFVAYQIKTIKIITPFITGLYFSLFLFENVNEDIEMILQILFMIVWTLEVLDVVMATVTYGTNLAIQKSGDKSDETVYRFTGRALKVVLYIIVFLIIISNLGYNVNSLIAGLGITGIAVALAVQAILGDFISSLSIIADKPFKPGDVISYGQYIGTVEKIGLKSTRIRALDGEEIVAPNSEIAKTNILNYGTLKRRRSLHQIGVTYETPGTQLKEIPEIIKQILIDNPNVDNDDFRVNLVAFGDSSINYEVAFFVSGADYNVYLDIQQEVLFSILDSFNKEGIDFAYPTSTMILKNAQVLGEKV